MLAELLLGNRSCIWLGEGDSRFGNFIGKPYFLLGVRAVKATFIVKYKDVIS